MRFLAACGKQSGGRFATCHGPSLASWRAAAVPRTRPHLVLGLVDLLLPAAVVVLVKGAAGGLESVGGGGFLGLGEGRGREVQARAGMDE